jgi:hypothetical protein
MNMSHEEARYWNIGTFYRMRELELRKHPTCEVCGSNTIARVVHHVSYNPEVRIVVWR